MKDATYKIKLENTISLINDLVENLHHKTREEIHTDLQITLYMARK